ncbi:MAG: energy transducer TonB [Terracidiphilus sp.]
MSNLTPFSIPFSIEACSRAGASPAFAGRFPDLGWLSRPFFALFLLIAFTLVLAASAQESPAAAPANGQPTARSLPAQAPEAGGVTEAELEQMLVGKFLYLRGGYLGDSLSFNERGGLIGHSPRGSYTLSVVEIDRVHLTRHKVELEGARYGLHFLGRLPYQDPVKAVDRVKITPKKKVFRIAIDREMVVKPKKVKEKGKDKKKTAKGTQPPATQLAAAAAAEQAQTQIAAAPRNERPAGSSSVTTTIYPAHAAMVLKQALDNIFAPGLDARMMAAMPEFWQLYYQAADARTGFKPAAPAVIPDGAADRRAKLLTDLEAPSNEFAQQCGVAGMALYHAVVGADGKVGEVAVARPIGFGLDESAVAAIRKARFEPAIKDGKPVPVLLDLVVEFRIYSKRTSVEARPEAAAKPAATPAQLGPYSVQRP